MPLENPNEVVRPDFAAEEHQPAHQQLVNDGLTEDQATYTLASLWTSANNTNKVHWVERQDWIQELCQQEEEEGEQHNQTLQDKEESAQLEEQKKKKNKKSNPLLFDVSEQPHSSWHI
ncbi:hypothetical protein EDB19DRAFT_1835767 [Suillus lakei]|nr:hypothetical protein EDB19DRAFT_1835767 [Suillus lakei]